LVARSGRGAELSDRDIDAGLFCPSLVNARRSSKHSCWAGKLSAGCLGFLAKCPMNPLVTPILLRLAGHDPHGPDAQLDPPYRQRWRGSSTA
jgi:hypothetical protein